MNGNKCQNIRRVRSWIPLAITAAVALLWTLCATAGTKTIVTSEVIGSVVLVPGEWTFPGGNIHIQGHAGVSTHLSADPNHNGLLYWEGNIEFDANWNGVFNGTWRLVAGEFVYDDLGVMQFDENGAPLLIPNGSVWEGNFHNWMGGDLQTNHAPGHGVQGDVEGLQVVVNVEGPRSGPLINVIYVMDPKAKK